MKVLNPKIHGVLDYLIVAAFLLAPSLLGFGYTATVLTYTLAAVHLGLSLLTDYPLGAVKAIPFTVHGALEFVIALMLVAFPWLLGFDRDLMARNFYVVSGVTVFAVWLLTDYQAAGLTTDDRTRHLDLGAGGGLPSAR